MEQRRVRISDIAEELGLSIPYVYFILSLEECVRFGISLVVFRRRHWMRVLKS